MKTEKAKNHRGVKAGKKAEAVLILIGLLSVFYLAMASDAEVIGKSELFFGMIMGITLLLIGVYLQKLKLLLRQLMYPVTITIMKALLCFRT